MNVTLIQIIVTLLSILLFLRIHWVRAGSSSLMRLMRMKKQNIVNEIDLKKSGQLNRKDVLEMLSFLNLVAKMYLNSGINTNMLRTFEGTMLKVFDVPEVREEYANIYDEFKNKLKTSEPPYINLIFAVDIIKKSNKMQEKRSRLMALYSRYYLWYKKFQFNLFPGSNKNWKLAEKLFLDIQHD